MTDSVSLGLRANARQFSLLVALNAVVGALAGLERSVLSLVGEDEFGVVSTAATRSAAVAKSAPSSRPTAFVSSVILSRSCAPMAR